MNETNENMAEHFKKKYFETIGETAPEKTESQKEFEKYQKTIEELMEIYIGEFYALYKAKKNLKLDPDNESLKEEFQLAEKSYNAFEEHFVCVLKEMASTSCKLDKDHRTLLRIKIGERGLAISAFRYVLFDEENTLHER